MAPEAIKRMVFWLKKQKKGLKNQNKWLWKKISSKNKKKWASKAKIKGHDIKIALKNQNNWL